MDRRALAVDVGSGRPRADQRVEVARLELVRLARQRLEIADAEVARAGVEEVAEGERGERRVAAGAAAADREPPAVDVAARDQEARRGDDVVDVDDAPAAGEALAVGAAVAGRAAVVDVDDREAAAGPELARQRQRGVGRAGRAAMARDQQRRQRAGRPGEVADCAAGSRRRARPRRRCRAKLIVSATEMSPGSSAISLARRKARQAPLARSRRTIASTSVSDAAMQATKPSPTRRFLIVQNGVASSLKASPRTSILARCERPSRSKTQTMLPSAAKPYIAWPKTQCGSPNSASSAMDRLDPPRALAVEVPPAAAIGDEVQLAGGRPARLVDRFVADRQRRVAPRRSCRRRRARRPRARCRATACADGPSSARPGARRRARGAGSRRSRGRRRGPSRRQSPARSRPAC